MTAITGFLRSTALAIIFLGLTFGMVCSIAIAKTYHRHHHFSSATSSPFIKATNTSMLKEAQTHLRHLGYYTGASDGKMGSKTKKALAAFQRDHQLSPTGKLNAQTSVALIEADRAFAPGTSVASSIGRLMPPPPDFFATHPDFYGYYNQAYADPMMLAKETTTTTTSTIAPGDKCDTPVTTTNTTTHPPMQNLPSRFAQIELTQNAGGQQKTYSVTVDSERIFKADSQPAVIGISKTFQLGDEDAIIFTAYDNGNQLCPYKHYLLTLHSGSNHLQDIGNCTNGYQAKIANNSLFVVFPEKDVNNAVGATWRYESGDLERL